MVGITLSPEQIRSAPSEVRQWLEREIATSLGLRAGYGAPMGNPEHLVACTPQEAMALYMAIRGMLPVVNVFFELGREGESIGQDGIEALRIADILRRARLPGVQQVGACLDVIDQAFRQIRHDANAALYVLDPKGYCVIATETQRCIMEVWNQLITAQQLRMPEPQAGVGDGIKLGEPARFPFSETSATLPPAAAYLDGTSPVAIDEALANQSQGAASPNFAA
ncbi:hypothetical protein ACQY1H_23525 (plasmid) [Agrobacterium vitis]|uniref:hypothetical protein n=1 Tax=Agrobacterium vitis TaxID=373 RepID=UPI003D2B5A92